MVIFFYSGLMGRVIMFLNIGIVLCRYWVLFGSLVILVDYLLERFLLVIMSGFKLFNEIVVYFLGKCYKIGDKR